MKLYSDWHCDVFGSGDTPLVFVHGWCCEGGQFGLLAKEFAKSHRIFCPDLPGHGRTPLGTFSPGFETYADALAGWIEGQRLDRPILIGHSMGGALALMTATRVAVRSVINLDGSLPAAPATLAAQKVIREWLDLPDFRSRLAEALRGGFFLPHERDARAEEIIRKMTAAPKAVLRFLPETIGSLDPSRILARIKAPVLYIGAQKPRYDATTAKTLLPDVQIERLPDAGHFLHVYAPAQVAALARAFLSPTSKAN